MLFHNGMDKHSKNTMRMSNIDEKIIFEPTGFEYQNTKAKVVIVGITPVTHS